MFVRWSIDVRVTYFVSMSAECHRVHTVRTVNLICSSREQTFDPEYIEFDIIHMSNISTLNDF